MYWIENKNGLRQPRANAPRANITNLREVFTSLDRQEQSVAHVEFSTGEHLDINVPPLLLPELSRQENHDQWKRSLHETTGE